MTAATQADSSLSVILLGPLVPAHAQFVLVPAHGAPVHASAKLVRGRYTLTSLPPGSYDVYVFPSAVVPPTKFRAHLRAGEHTETSADLSRTGILDPAEVVRFFPVGSQLMSQAQQR